MKVEQIKGGDIGVGDVIRSAAMREPMLVRDRWVSSTGNTVEMTASTVNGEFPRFFRVGIASTVKRYTKEGAA